MDDVKKFHTTAETQLNNLQQACEALVLRFNAAVEQGACWTARAFDAIPFAACSAPWALTLAVQHLNRSYSPVSQPPERAATAEHESRLRGVETALETATRERDHLATNLAAAKEQHDKALADAGSEQRRAVGDAESAAASKVTAAETAAAEATSAVARLTAEKEQLVCDVAALQERCNAAQTEASKVAGLDAVLKALGDQLRAEQQKTAQAVQQAAAAAVEKDAAGEKLKAAGEAQKKLARQIKDAENAAKAKGAKETSLGAELAKATAAREEAEQKSGELAKEVEELKRAAADTGLHIKQRIESAAAEQAAVLVETAKKEMEAGVAAQVEARTAEVTATAKVAAEAAVQVRRGACL